MIHYSNDSLGGIDKRYAEYIEHDNCSLIAHKSTTHLLALQLKEKKDLVSQQQDRLIFLKLISKCFTTLSSF